MKNSALILIGMMVMLAVGSSAQDQDEFATLRLELGDPGLKGKKMEIRPDAIFSAATGRAITFEKMIAEMADALMPVGQVQIVYNGAHTHVVDAVRDYAKDRTECQNPFGWRQYLKVQTLFLRFCWYDAVDRLMAQQRGDRRMLASGPAMEVSDQA